MLAFAYLLGAWPSHAEGRRILVLVAEKPPEFWPWLNAELASAGFSVQMAEAGSAPPELGQIEKLATRWSTTLGLAPLEAGHGLQIWLLDPVSHRLVFREVILGLYDPSDPPDLVAVRMVETLRATLIQLQKEGRASTQIAPPVPERSAAKPLPSRPSRFALGLGGGGAFSPGGAGAIALLHGSFAYAFVPRFAIVLGGALTPIASQLHRDEGSASLSWYWAGAALRVGVTDPRATLSLRSGAGIWLVRLTSRGQAAPPLADGGGSSLSAVPHVDVGLRWSLTRRLWLTGDLSAGFSTPRVRIDFAGREAAAWGRPLGLGLLSLEILLD